MATVLVTGAGGPLGANVTRCLRRAPRRLRLVGSDANPWHLPLALTDTTYRIPAAQDRAAYCEALQEIISREGVEVVLPTHPVEVRAVAALHEEGRMFAGTALPRTAVLERADDKVATWRALARAGVPVPRTRPLLSGADLEASFDEFAQHGDPVWVRGSGAPGLGLGGAALPCRDLATARAWVEHHRGWGKMAASEYLPGANLTWMAVFDRGHLLAAGSRERLEYVLSHVAPSGITGAPAVSRTLDRADVAAIGEGAVRVLDDEPHGVYFVDLKEDKEGGPRVTEINAGRCGTTVMAYTEAGCNFPWYLVQLAGGEHPPPLPEPNRAVESDVYWLRTLDCGPVALRGREELDRYPCAGPSGRGNESL